MLVTDLKNIRYLCGVPVSAGCVLVRRSLELFVDSRYFEAAKKTAKRGVAVRPIEELEKTWMTLKKVAVESEQVTLDRFARWKKKYKRVKFAPTTGIVAELRREKSPQELELIRHACSISLKVLSKIPGWLKEGITERELAWKIDSACHELGAETMAFDTIVAFGEHSAIPHHHPTERRLKKGDVVQIDMGSQYRGYASDFSRVHLFGSAPTVEQAKALRALKKAKKSAEALVRAGASTHALDRAARKELKAFGYGEEFSHSLGHGLGLDIHEGVTLSQKAPKKTLLKNEVITIEPGLYFAGKWGMRLEDTVTVSR